MAEEISKESLTVIFLILGLFIGGIVHEIKSIYIPKSSLILIIGVIIGGLSKNLGLFGDSIDLISEVDPVNFLIQQLLLLIYIPVKIFSGSYNCDFYIFKKQLLQVFVLIGPCVVLGAFLNSIGMKMFLELNHVFSFKKEIFNLGNLFLFGAILCCTDTVAIVSSLKETGAPKKLSALIETESLLNDATCMLLLRVSLHVLKNPIESKLLFTRYIMELVLGGVFIGILGGVLVSFWLKRIFNDEVLIINIMIFSSYIVYYFSSQLEFPFRPEGIVSLMVMSMWIGVYGKSSISGKVRHSVSIFWNFTVFLAENIMFLISGILIGTKIVAILFDISIVRYFILYLIIFVSRFLSISFFMPWLQKWAYGLKWKEVFVITFGGIRGAIGISFTLVVYTDDSLPQEYRQFVFVGILICTLLSQLSFDILISQRNFDKMGD